MKVINIAEVPAPNVQAESSVVEALRAKEKVKGGACVVMEADQLVGILSERDLMLRVMGAGRDPKATCVQDVMTRNLSKVDIETESAEALNLMMSQHIRHLPVVNQDGSLAGLLSMRNLVQPHVEELTDQLNSIVAYFSADGPGG